MAETLTTAVAETFSLSSAYTAAVVDQDNPGAGHTVTFNPAGTNYYRTYLCSSGGSGALASPIEWISYVQSILGARWTCALAKATGLMTITATGTGTSSITWSSGSGLFVRAICGFTGDISLAQNATATATYQPRYMAFACARTNDTGWQPEFNGIGVAELPADVDALGDGSQKLRRFFALWYLPRTAADATALSNSPVTAYFPDDAQKTRKMQPTLTASNTSFPWSWHELIATSAGVQLGLSLGDFQTLASSGRYDIAKWDTATLAGMKNVQPTVAAWKQRVNRTGLGLVMIDDSQVIA